MVTHKAGISNDAYAAAQADADAQRREAKAQRQRPFIGRRKYPGRQIVTDTDTVNEITYRNFINSEGDTSLRPFQCERPYVQAAIGLPDAKRAMDRYWSYRDQGKVFTEVKSRCRKCPSCLAHRRRLWSARASDELKAAHRTWFATLTVAPHERFVATLAASGLAENAGHGAWPTLAPETKFKYLVKHLNQEIDRYFKRVRKTHSLRYLLVSESHKDGFPHFHALIHEEALPLTKRLLESNWRVGFSQFRLVDSADPRSAFYVCKYLSKDAQTRVRASRRYGQPTLVRHMTDVITEVLRTRGDVQSTPPVIRGLSAGPLTKMDEVSKGAGTTESYPCCTSTLRNEL